MTFMSSPFRSAHRRSRSHTSLSSPSSSPLPIRSDRDRHLTYTFRSPLLVASHVCGTAEVPSDSPFTAASEFAAQPPEKWDVEAWRRGKRARHNPESPSEDADMESCDEPMPCSPVTESQPPSSPLSMSAPSTPLPRFPSTSESFQFFPPKSSSSDTRQTSGSSDCGLFPSANEHHDEPLNHLSQAQSDAFNDLRKTVSEAGEGFVRRMREFEAHRSRGSSRASKLPSQPDRLAPHKCGRKRPSPMSARQFKPQCANMSVISGRGSDYEEGESDIEIQSTWASGSDEFRGWSPSKKRAVSLSALSYQDTAPGAHPFPIPLRRRNRSLSPSGSEYSETSSDDEEEITSSSGGAADRMRHRRALRFRSKATSSLKPNPPPLSFSFSTSNSSSHLSFGASMPSPASLYSGSLNTQSSSDCSRAPTVATGFGPGSSLAANANGPRTSKSTEKAVAALSLALANGAGSVSDYEALREAHDVLAMDNGEAGSLWN